MACQLRLFSLFRHEKGKWSATNQNYSLHVNDVFPVRDRDIFLNIFSRLIIFLLVKLAQDRNGRISAVYLSRLLGTFKFLPRPPSNSALLNTSFGRIKTASNTSLSKGYVFFFLKRMDLANI